MTRFLAERIVRKWKVVCSTEKTGAFRLEVSSAIFNEFLWTCAGTMGKYGLLLLSAIISE